jgi:hypothetical protein
MSAVAGVILILMGGATLALGGNEILHPNQLTPFAARTTAILGFVMVLIGLLHFRAPHKAFLLSIPVLIYLHVQMYIDFLFLFNDPRWMYLAGLALLSIVVLLLSYKGYLSARETAGSPA